ncbi:tRNA nucleotidyltransferase cca2-like [Rutidosis leptorrhynchoides]|uniref:tRNA nucleotidyltransferase cca2-like n=1 Tax=Rutidosis leptorrhynchoides TaxID=125765 RepID=UPI003A9A56D1
MSRTNVSLSSPKQVRVMESVNITDKERQIFDLLLQVVKHFNLETQLRVAGGWVRDKLLGKECYDIDIALDNMLGREFCEKVNDYFVSMGQKTQGFGVIKSNPDKSKHLEIAKIHLFDVSIDFVNLSSRIGITEYGTPEQDAYRRDLTINSLFYNLNTSVIEDFTGRGIDDLKCGRIVTPLPPKVMFLDDPCVVLRAIRFSARFEFDMVEEIKIAAVDNDVKTAISDKITRERIGHEIDLMISGNQPVKAMELVSELGLFWVVFTLPSNFEVEISDRICVNYVDEAWRFLRALGACTMSNEQRRLYLYAALFLPFRKTNCGDNKKRIVSPLNHIFKRSLKLNADNVIRLHNAVEKFKSLIPFMVSNEECVKRIEVNWNPDMIDVPVSLELRILLGLILKEVKDLWRAALMLSILLDKEDSSVESKIGVFREIEGRILKLGLENLWEVKPLINGGEIMKLLEVENGGLVVGKWQQKVIQWQLAYPCGNVDECGDWLMSQTRRKIDESIKYYDTYISQTHFGRSLHPVPPT